MSFPALYLACQAAEHLPPLDDDEFGLGWSDITAPPFEIRWVRFLSEGAGLVLGVSSVEMLDSDGFIDLVDLPTLYRTTL